MDDEARQTTGTGVWSAMAVFVRDRVSGASNERLWRTLAISLGLISACSFAIKVYSFPTDAISDDARMFLSWMGQWENGGLLRGDFVADYWRAVSPWAYSALFRAAWAFGISPVTFAKVFPTLIFVPVAFYTFRFIRAVGGQPIVGFLVTAAVLHYLARANLIVTSTPRALWPVLLLMMLDGLARKRIWQTAIAQLLLTGAYPQMAITTATLVGLTLLSFAPLPRLKLDRLTLLLVASSALATICGIAPFLLSSGSYAPSFTLTEAMQIPTFGPSGRGAIFPAEMDYNLLCGSRLSFIVDCESGAILKPSLEILAAFGGSMILFYRTLRPSGERLLSSQLPLLLALASLVWFFIAGIVLFRLHLPNRYTAAMELLIYITALPLLLEWLFRMPFFQIEKQSKSRQTILSGSAMALLVVCAIGAADVRVGLKKPNQEFIAALRALPDEAVIGGFVEELDFSPVLTNRSTLFSRELSIAYQKGYFLPILARMEAVKDIVLATEHAVLVERILQLQMTHMVVRQADMATVRIPEGFRGFFEEDQLIEQEKTAEAAGAILPRLVANCTAGIFGGIALVPTACMLSDGSAE